MKSHFAITPKILVQIAAGIILAVLFVSLGWRTVNFVARPELFVETPQEGIILSEPLAEVKGKTQRESQLTVNGRELRIDNEGRFGETIELLRGVNTLEFLAQNRFGKQSKVVRNVIVKDFVQNLER